MQRPWMPIVLAAVLSGTAGVIGADAQTVVVRNAPPNIPVEVFFNAASAGAGTTDASGVATIPANMKEAIGKIEIDANVSVDVCAQKRRIVIVEVGAPAVPVDAGCDRRPISGLYWVRPVNTIVVNFAGAAPSVLLIKGRYGIPVQNADGTTPEEASGHSWRQSPTGLVVTGAVGLSKYRDQATVACGNVTPCSGDETKFAYSFGGIYWIKRFLGIEGTYMKPGNLEFKGGSGGSSFTFTSTLDADVWTLAGLVGGPIGPVRLYGKVGADYAQATSTTTEKISDATQTLAFRTKGFGWVFGGGTEWWMTSRVAVFGEVGMQQIRGDAEAGGEAKISDQLRSVMVGARVHIGRH
jgi:hypothetical protein